MGKTKIIKEATKIVNDVLKMFGEELIEEPKQETPKDKLEFLLDKYTDKLIKKNPQYKIFKNKKDIPEMVVLYLKKEIERLG
jgi:GTP cyclohydrolase I